MIVLTEDWQYDAKQKAADVLWGPLNIVSMRFTQPNHSLCISDRNLDFAWRQKNEWMIFRPAPVPNHLSIFKSPDHYPVPCSFFYLALN